MRILILIILGSILLSSCYQVDKCRNRFDFISSNDSIPILNLDYSEAPEFTLKKINNLYENDLCKKCDWVKFKSPFEIEGKKGYLKLIADFNYPYCSNCPITMKLKNYFQILINANNQILAKGKLVTIESLKKEIKNYLSKVGVDNNFPENYKQVNYSIQWDRNSKSKFIDSVFTSIFTSHTDFIINKTLGNGVDFCSLENTKLTELKIEYPLRIQISSGKSIEILNSEQIERK